MFPAEAESPFDILIYDNSNMYGYCPATDERTIILNWVEAGFSSVFDANIGVLPNSRIFVYTVSMINTERYDINLDILTPTPREDVPDVITLTLGGFFIYDDTRHAVVEFNRENEGFQIIIRDYWDEMDGDRDWDAAQLRFRTEIITGRGPDIIFFPDSALSDSAFLVDLYPFIDADSEFSRADFFPNALKALEASDGSLTTVTGSFQISTMFGLPDVVGHIEQSSWTTQMMLALLKENEEMFAPFGQWEDRINFIHKMLRFSGDDLINWSSGEAFLDSDDFISILEAAAFLPSRDELMDVYQGTYVGDRAKLRLGERLLLEINIFSPLDYQLFANDGDVYILGNPTFEGGRNILQPAGTRLGINASSKYADEAWLFLRQLILQTYETGREAITGAETERWQRRRSLPILIEMYDDLIDLAMTQIMEGESIVPHGFIWVDDYDDNNIPFYAMTQNEADDLRVIIDGAVPWRRRLGDEVWNHLVDDLNAFFAGGRTASDTARIMQNRVQTYLNEQ
jgi:hypothetical protein